MTDVDVIIVGASQAGCAAAYDLAAAGLSVLLLDRQAGTKHKPCADNMTEKARRLYRFPLDSVVRETVSQMQISMNLKFETPFTANSPVYMMTHRPELDQLCREQAQQVDTTLKITRQISAINNNANVMVLSVDVDVIAARYLIGADGANGVVRRVALGGDARHEAMAIEGLLSREHCQRY